MQRVRLVCPLTKVGFNFEIPVDHAGLAEHWRDRVNLSCPHCGSQHGVSIREMFLAWAVSDDRLRSLPPHQPMAQA
jgi:hypothetical protein